MKIYIPSAEQPEYWLPGGFLSTDTEWLQTKGLQILTSRDSSTKWQYVHLCNELSIADQDGPALPD